MARGERSNSTLNLAQGEAQPLSPPLPPLPPPTPQIESIQQIAFGKGPSYPSSWASTGEDAERGRRAQHARRPSRAERYETLVEHARELLERDQRREPVGLGIDSEEHLQITEEDWRQAVENLLKVVDGMVRQLATHDELAAQLKIAQSNLTLAETHSEFLEETLRRRDSRSSAQMVSRHSASGTSTSNGTGRPDEPRPSTESSTSLFGMGFEDSRNSAASFFRMPSSKRKQTPSVVSNASSVASLPPPPQPSHHTLRSSSSSPRLRTSPATYDDQPPPPALAGSASKTVSQLTSELFAMHSQVTSLEQSCQALKITNTSLRRSADGLAGRCAELEKTKDDLMSELENLSMELFQEANTMVADERKARAKAEEEVLRLRSEISSLSNDLEQLRKNGSSTSSPSASLALTEKRDSVGSARTLQAPSRRSTAPTNLSLPEGSVNSSPHLAGASPTISVPSPDPSEAASATSSRKWFNFGRSGSVKAARSVDGSESGEGRSPNPESDAASSRLQLPSAAPRMARGDSGNSVRSLSSVSSSFFSAVSADEGEREELLLDDQEAEDSNEIEVTTPLVSDNGRPKIASNASLYPLPPSPNLSHPPPPSLRIDTSPPLSRRDTAPSSTSSTRFQRAPAQIPSSSFSTDSSPAASPRFAPSPGMSQSRTPRQPLASSLASAGDAPSRGRPVAIHSFEGQEIAKSPKSPNAMRWNELAGALPPAATSPRLGGGAAAIIPRPMNGDGDSAESGRSLSVAGRRSEESSRARSPLLPASALEREPEPSSDKQSEQPTEQQKEQQRPSSVQGSNVRVPGHRPPPLKLETSLANRASPSPTGSTFSASAVPVSISRTKERSTPSPPPSSAANPRPRTNSSSRPTFVRSVSSRSASSLSSAHTAAPAVASPTFTLPSSGSNPLSLSTSTSLSSLRSPGAAVDDLEGLMRNIEAMNSDLFGDDDDDSEEDEGKAEAAEAKRRDA